ncbi:MAG: acyltransferase [Aestuariivirga sp.]
MLKPISKLVNIQILRAVAALTVVLYHVGVEETHICTDTGGGCAPDMWFGLDGVTLFFMISGFIMVVTSWNLFGKPGAAVDFIRRRIQRIVPLYWIVTTIGVIGIAIAPSMLNVPVLDPIYIAASYLFYPVERLNGLVRPIANLGWTLELEMMFYVIFTGALLFKRKLGMSLAMAAIVLITAGRLMGLYGQSIPLNFWSDPIILDFVLGMAVGAAYKSGANLPRSAVWGLGVAFVVFATTVVVQAPWINSFPELHIVRRSLLALPAIPLFLIGALGPQLNASNLLTRIGLLLGDASYSLYLIHPFVLRPFAKIWDKLFVGHVPMWAFTCGAPIAAISSGLALYWFVERPLTNYFTKKRPLKAALFPASSATFAPQQSSQSVPQPAQYMAR